ncbi:MAG TPA: UDP-N-acetylglucosamine--N-acetylmuramyl-(pentapeptide) pyrophosphoryl-undecaprenol N-acetylglucosamine transferase, partial [Bacteroidales bacterium]|nr:UDP-N-acetylglucosamine--N-acetylmuramyl-(pentapeptide) pyrophosphoryl-undecaprenol N-acetylglucosamine transferase [Bacteroidales bacterium]
AARMGIPILLQEQNGFAGVTNKMLRNDATTICVAYDGMDRFFPKEKIILTGNPVRQNLEGGNRTEAASYFHLQPDKKTLLIIGGSLGARTINESIISSLSLLQQGDIQVIWQSGKTYYAKCKEATDALQADWLVCTDFLSRMDLAYALADIVISRAGASSISELCLLGKPCILVPSPNVAEDHQTHNAMALVEKNAAVLVRDADAQESLIPTALSLINDKERLQTLHTNILTLGQHNSAERIANEVIRIARNR